jgi:uncharacterized protein (TIGR02145 family)
MSKNDYNLIWKEGSFFEKGHWKLVPKDSNSGFGYLIGLAIILFIAFCFILTLPLWISLIGFSMVKQKRHYAGIASLLALLYFIVDINKKWISGYLMLGYYSSSGSFNEGFFGAKYLVLFFIANAIGTVIAFIFIIQSYYLNKNDSVNRNQSIIILLSFVVVFAIFSGIFSSTKDYFTGKQINQNEIVTTPIDTSNQEIFSEEKRDEEDNSEIKVIGTQTWMTENLDIITFRNGDTIFEAKTKEDWMKASKLHIPAWCYYDNDKDNGEKYGCLYNWYAVMDERGLAPLGFHIPNNLEYDTFLLNLGLSHHADSDEQHNIASMLKSTSNLWSPIGDRNNETSTNSSGFSALPSGLRYEFGSFNDINEEGHWWTSENIWHSSYNQVKSNKMNPSDLSIDYWVSGVGAGSFDAGTGLAVRCIKGEINRTTKIPIIEEDSTDSSEDENDMTRNIKSANELEVADENLNLIYKQVLAVLNESEKTTLKYEQRKWIKYRDVSCEEETKDMDGSMYNAFLNNCKKEKTEKRIEELNEILESKK